MSSEPTCDEDAWKDDDFLSFDAPQAENSVADAFLSEGKKTGDPSMVAIASNDLPPWMDNYTDFRRVSPLVALHNEIVGFCDLMSPMPEVSTVGVASAQLYTRRSKLVS